MMIPLILLAVIVLVLIISIILLKEVNVKDQSSAVPSVAATAVGKASFSLGLPLDNTSVSLASRMDIAVEAPHSLVGADFSGSMKPVQDLVIEPVKEPLKVPVKEVSPVLDMKLKYEKLEQMLGEKNKEIEGLKKDLEIECSTRGEFEILRKTFLEQIEELKMQNRKSKADLQSVIQENAELKSALSKRPGPIIEEYIRAEVDTAPDIILGDSEGAEIPLKDIFNQNNIKNEGEV
jgi:hypothetical protein